MLVVEQIKGLALQPADPDRILALFPKTKSVVVRGQSYIVVPHGVDEVKVLRNIGINAPSPILHYYDWPGPFRPYEHQKQTAAFLTLHQRCFVLNEIGTGKTQAALWAADYLMRVKKVKKVLIMSPLSTLERVWGDAIFAGFVDRKFVILHGSAERRRKLLRTEVDFYIINHDGFPIIADAAHGKFDLVIVDEAAVLRNPRTRRFKVFKKWLDYNPKTRLWLLTGTPTPNAPTDAWALAKLVGVLGLPTYTAFRDMVMTKAGQFRYVPRKDAVEKVRKILQPAVRFAREECFDLPETIFQTRHAELTPEQKKYFDQMFKHLIAEVKHAGTITAANEAVKIQKLVQIVCGVAYGDDGQHIELDCAPRVNVVKEVIEEAGEKVIVFVPLTGTLRMLENELSKHWSVGVVNGEVPAHQRDRIFYQFQHERDPHVLIAHPGTMAHGLTLTAASTIIWYGPVNSNEVYVQANGRIERLGKKRVANVVHIESTPLERMMYTRLKQKQRMQGLLLDLIQQQTERSGR